MKVIPKIKQEKGKFEAVYVSTTIIPKGGQQYYQIPSWLGVWKRSERPFHA